MSKNTNCLKGMRCPMCGHEDSFSIAVNAVARMTDEGSDYITDIEYGDDSTVWCGGCGAVGKVGDLYGEVTPS